MFEKVITFFREHPVWLGVAVFGVGLLLLWWFGFFSKSPAASNDAAAYYAAETAAQQAAVAQQASANAASVQTAGIMAQADVLTTQSNNQLEAIKQQVDYLKAASMDSVSINGQNTAAAKNIAQITANTNDYIASTVATENVDISKAQEGGAVAIAQAQASAAYGIAMVQAVEATKQTAITASTAQYTALVNDYTALEMFIASPAAGASQGGSFGPLPTPPVQTNFLTNSPTYP